MSRTYEKMNFLIEEISMGPFGSNIKVEYFVDSGVPVLNGSNVSGVKLKDGFDNFVTKERATGYRKAIAKRGDIVITHRGTLGQIAYIPVDSEFERYVISQSQFKVSLKTELINPVYFTYYFHSKEGQKRLLSFKSHVGVPALAQATTNFRLLDFPMRPKPEQDAIAKVLESIDKKIELNNKINTELDAMSKLIYEYWFVRFDFPDANGKPYRSSGGNMVYNEELKREIPEGWGVDIINNVIDVKDGTHDSPKYQGSGHPLITSKHLKPKGLDFVNANLISEEDYVSINKRSKVETGDILFSMIGSIGDIYKVDEKSINFAIKNVALYKSSRKPEYINFIYMFLKSNDMLRYMVNVTSGSIQKFIGLGALRSMPILINEEVISKFVRRTEPLFQQMTLVKEENQKLVELRDWLLPMLMNGQVSIKTS